MKTKRDQKRPVRKAGPTPKPRARTRRKDGEDHLGATEEQVGDRTGSGAGYDQRDKSTGKPPKGGVQT
jgi:hypothetical protein